MMLSRRSIKPVTIADISIYELLHKLNYTAEVINIGVEKEMLLIEEKGDPERENTQWVQRFMSPTSWQHYREMYNAAGYSDEAAPAITEPAPHTGGSWFLSL